MELSTDMRLDMVVELELVSTAPHYYRRWQPEQAAATQQHVSAVQVAWTILIYSVLWTRLMFVVGTRNCFLDSIGEFFYYFRFLDYVRTACNSIYSNMSMPRHDMMKNICDFWFSVLLLALQCECFTLHPLRDETLTLLPSILRTATEFAMLFDYGSITKDPLEFPTRAFWDSAYAAEPDWELQ
jgi:hypothetical protein